MTSAGQRLALGTAGEEQAAQWYLGHGFRVLDRNWRCSFGEIDLVCRRGGTLAVVEVKARSSRRYGHPEEAVTPVKRRRLRRLAAAWLAESSMRVVDVRFDVVSIVGGTLEVFEDAF